MKQHKILFIITITILSTAISCCNIYMDETDIKGIITENALINSKVDKISSKEATNIALKNRGIPITKSGENMIEVIPILNNDGDTLIYAISFPDKEGYELISHYKSYFPIVADVIGCDFNDSLDSKNIVLSHYIKEIEKYRLSISDSLKAIMSLWEQYEDRNYDHDRETIITRSEGNLLSLVSQSIQEWENEGYVVCELAEDIDGLPDNIYEYFLDVAESIANPDYDYLHNSFVLYKNYYSGIGSVSPLIQTRWSRYSPFNTEMPYSSMTQSNYEVSPAAVALAQIMHFYSYPTSYSWNNMPLTSSSNDINTLLRSLSDQMSTTYAYSNENNCNVSYTLRSGLINSIYANGYQYNSSSTSLTQSISNGHPVIMHGDQDWYYPTYWICDGFNNYQLQRTYYLMVLSIDSPLHYENACSPYGPVSIFSYDSLHINWCDGTSGQYATTASQLQACDGRITGIRPINQ